MDINVTYDLLFDILRNEKSREEIQKLDDKFYSNVVDYINTKESIIRNPATSISEQELTRIQLSNVRKLLSELYERREKKIINLAIYKIKTGSGVINTQVLLEEEKIFFEDIYSKLSKFRSEIIQNVLSGKIPALNSSVEKVSTASAVAVDTKDSYEGDLLVKSVRIISAVPKFLGSELETYGPYEENDIVSLPSKIANVLIKKDRAEEIRVS